MSSCGKELAVTDVKGTLITCTSALCRAKSQVEKLIRKASVEVNFDADEQSFWATMYESTLLKLVGEFNSVSELEEKIKEKENFVIHVDTF